MEMNLQVNERGGERSQLIPQFGQNLFACLWARAIYMAISYLQSTEL